MSEERHISIIGARDLDYTITQYTEHADEYIEANPEGRRGGKTPAKRVAVLSRYLPSGRTVFEVGSGPGHDARALLDAGYAVIASDVAWPFISTLRKQGFDALHFDARKDKVPQADAIFSHIAAQVHISPQEFAKFLSRVRASLTQEKAFYLSVIEGYGHERWSRTGFSRDWTYYTPKRFKQILDQEKYEISSLDRVVAFNGTPTIHAAGNIGEGYQGGSYGEKGLHPFGDVYYDLRVLYEGNIMSDFAKILVEAGSLDSETRDHIKFAEEAYVRGWLNLDDFTDQTLELAQKLRGQDVNVLQDLARRDINQRHPFRKRIREAFAVCNNNGFSNIVNGYGPSWLMEVVAKNLGADAYLATQWVMDPDGQITGGIIKSSLKKNVRVHQEELRKWLGIKYRRITVGIGVDKQDEKFMSRTDYPLMVSADEKCKRFAYNQGYFHDQCNQFIYAPYENVLPHPWFRWGVVESGDDLVLYLSMVTSDRHPVKPDPNKSIPAHIPFWQSEFNVLNEAFYGKNPLTAEII